MSTTREERTVDAEFPETRWSLVRRAAAAAGANGADAGQALEEICRDYWLPIYAYLRQTGHGRQDAEDYTQDFFERILSKNVIARADAEFGKLRSFLLGVLKNSLSDGRKRRNARKRGSGVPIISIEAAEVESRLASRESAGRSPEESYDFHWALAVIESAVGRLREDYSAKGKTALFEALAPSLQGTEGATYREHADKLGMTETAMKVAAHRLRIRFREAVRAQVADTLEAGADVDEELGYLRTVLHRSPALG